MKKVIAKIRAPKGFSFKIAVWSQDNIQVSLHTNKNLRRIGWINLYLVRKGYYETHSNLEIKYHNRGLGARLYARAIQYCLEQGWHVQSSGMSSEEAERVWKGKTLRKYFNIRSYMDYKWFAYAK